MTRVWPILLLLASNVFMTYAWYGHLKDFKNRPLALAVLASWGVAFFEYCLQVPANRWGAAVYSISQLKIIQEIITMLVFAGFATWYLGQRLSWNYLWAGLCLAGAAFFLFREMPAAQGASMTQSPP